MFEDIGRVSKELISGISFELVLNKPLIVMITLVMLIPFLVIDLSLIVISFIMEYSVESSQELMFFLQSGGSVMIIRILNIVGIFLLIVCLAAALAMIGYTVFNAGGRKKAFVAGFKYLGTKRGLILVTISAVILLFMLVLNFIINYLIVEMVRVTITEWYIRQVFGLFYFFIMTYLIIKFAVANVINSFYLGGLKEVRKLTDRTISFFRIVFVGATAWFLISIIKTLISSLLILSSGFSLVSIIRLMLLYTFSFIVLFFFVAFILSIVKEMMRKANVENEKLVYNKKIILQNVEN